MGKQPHRRCHQRGPLAHEILTRCSIKLPAHYIVTIVLAIAFGLAAYGCHTAYTRLVLAREQWRGRQHQLRQVTWQQQEMAQNQAGLQLIRRFVIEARDLGLVEKQWAFYDVHVQGAFDYDTARQIIEQCDRSDQVYYWPISLDMKSSEKDTTAPATGTGRPTSERQVQLTIKGRFVARQP